MSRLSTFPKGCVLSILLAAGECWAGTSAPFDVAGLLVILAAYPIGFLVLVIASVQTRIARKILLLYVAIPAIWFGIETVRKTSPEEQAKEIATGESQNLAAFGEFCKSRVRKTTPHRRFASAPPPDMTLLVRHEKSFTSRSEQISARRLSESLQRNGFSCAQSGVRSLEGMYPAEASPGYVATNKFRRFDICGSGNDEEVSILTGRYELVLGEVGKKASSPWGSQYRWMSSSSVRIIDRWTRTVLAEDTLFYLNYDSGVAGCPEVLDQVTSLIKETFAPAVPETANPSIERTSNGLRPSAASHVKR